MKRLIIDLDNTICTTNEKDYLNSSPIIEVVEKIKKYKKLGFEIVISTSRNMQTYKGCIGKINIDTLPIIISWLDRYEIPYDEIYVGKPWCGNEGFYVDDRAVRPSEFVSLTYEEILNRLGPHQ